MHWRALLLSWLVLLACAARADDAAAPVGVQERVVFTLASDDASSGELARRLVSPLNAWRLQQQAAATGMNLREQPIALARERFALYVPARPPPDGYALLVFVPPWDVAKVPPGWISTLDRHGTIMVTAAGSGNDTDLLDRRDPLALLAAANVMARYPVNPNRVYISGFSGGSRVALRLALGYPDLFRGVLLDAGSDPLGDLIPLPPRPLMARFQEATRVVYLTGLRDSSNQDTDRLSRQSLRDWCITDIDTLTMPWTGHELADPSSLSHALSELDAHHPADATTLAACRARIERELDAQLAKAQTLVDDGKTDEAKQLLEAIDRRYGGLAAPRSVELAARLQAVPAASNASVH